MSRNIPPNYRRYSLQQSIADYAVATIPDDELRKMTARQAGNVLEHALLTGEVDITEAFYLHAEYRHDAPTASHTVKVTIFGAPRQ